MVLFFKEKYPKESVFFKYSFAFKTIIERLKQIHSGQRFLKIPVQAAEARRSSLEAGGSVGSFFSAGVDAHYTLFNHEQEIEHLIHVVGFDFRLHEKALATLNARTTKVPSWYLDLALLSSYWSSDRFYHHTAPISMVYALYQALILVIEEGLAARLQRHLKYGTALQAGLEIDYVCADIRAADFCDGFDLAMLVFGEFNVFTRDDAEQLLVKTYKALKPGGHVLLEPLWQKM